MKKVKLDFTDFWPGFDKKDNYFYNLLSTKYEVEISENPDFLIYADFGKDYKKYRCIRIYFTGESHFPNFNECDYAFTFNFLDKPNHFRLPFYAYVLYADFSPESLIKKDLDVGEVLKKKTKFCNFVYSNHHAKERERFFKKLSKYKKVDSGGKYLNNIGGSIKDKLDFIKDYKFTIAFENASIPGYTTEKLVHPMLVNSLPIYWGNRLIERDFNTKSFLNYYDFNNEDQLIEKVIELDKNDYLYLTYLKEPYYYNNKVDGCVNPKNILSNLESIINRAITPIARQKKFLFWV